MNVGASNARSLSATILSWPPCGNAHRPDTAEQLEQEKALSGSSGRRCSQHLRCAEATRRDATPRSPSAKKKRGGGALDSAPSKWQGAHNARQMREHGSSENRRSSVSVAALTRIALRVVGRFPIRRSSAAQPVVVASGLTTGSSHVLRLRSCSNHSRKAAFSSAAMRSSISGLSGGTRPIQLAARSRKGIQAHQALLLQAGHRPPQGVPRTKSASELDAALPHGEALGLKSGTVQ